MFAKVLVANRGEIAVRIMRSLEELGVGTVAVYSEADREAPHVRRAGDAYLLGPGPPAESYLAVDRILDAALRAGAEAIHPGYGFLAENAAFARACEDAGVVFIGPPPEAIEAMGSKTRARELMHDAGVPIVPGTTGPVESVEDARAVIEASIGYPVAVKAVGAGGGRGLRVAASEDALKSAFEGAAGEGERFFADSRVYLERYLPDPRHVEVQLVADAHGNVVHLFERDCSVQRPHQKLVEESPAPTVDRELRRRIGRIAVEAARAVGYRSAGTVEGLLQDGQWFFLEMNARVQVEHCVTEMTTGVDVVREQVRVAAGEPLALRQEDVTLRGHAIECRINAEDAARDFAPGPGTITAYREPAGPFVRVDSGVEVGSEVSPLYDPLIAKVVAWDLDREAATRRMRRALSEFELGGVPTLIPFHLALLASDQWRAAETCRELVEDREWLERLAGSDAPSGEAGVGDAPRRERSYAVEVSGRRFDVTVVAPQRADGAGPAAVGPGAVPGRRAPTRRGRSGSAAGSSAEELVSPLQGSVLKVAVERGARVEEGALVCVIEAMKMENEITAHRSGTVEELGVAEGASVATGATIAVIR